MLTKLEIGNKLKESREYLGYSTYEVANYLKISPETIRNIENGRTCLKVEILQKLASLYMTPIENFLKSSTPELSVPEPDDLSAQDKLELLKFKEFLKYKAKC